MEGGKLHLVFNKLNQFPVEHTTLPKNCTVEIRSVRIVLEDVLVPSWGWIGLLGVLISS